MHNIWFFFTCCFFEILWAQNWPKYLGYQKNISLRVRSPWVVALLSKLWIFVTIYLSRRRLNQQFIWLSTFQKPNLYLSQRTEVWYRASCIYTQIFSPKKTGLFTHKKYFQKLFWLLFTFILCNFSVRALKYFLKNLKLIFCP